MAVTQEMVNCSTSKTPNQSIPVKKIVSFDKYQIGTDPNNAASADVGIIFSMDLLSPVREIKLVYPGTIAAATILRDASYAAVKAAISQTTV